MYDYIQFVQRMWYAPLLESVPGVARVGVSEECPGQRAGTAQS